MKKDKIGTLLAVDDEQEIRQLAAEFAEMWGFKVYLAADAKEALKILRSEKPDVIVSDLAMPGQDGIDFLKQIRDEGVQTPFLFLSAFMTEEHTMRSLNLGAIDFLPKPFTPRELKMLLYEMLAISKARQTPEGISNLRANACQRSEVALHGFMDLLRLGRSQDVLKHDFSEEFRSAEMVTLFSVEARRLINCAQEILKELQGSDIPGRQISCLFQMMRAIRLGAMRSELTNIRDLAQAIEHHYIQIRVHSIYLNPIGVMNLSVAHELLRRNFEAIESEQTKTNELKSALLRETKLKVQELRSVLDVEDVAEQS